MKLQEKPCNKSYSVPILNLSNCNLSNKEKQQVNLVWIINLLKKLKKVPKLLAANMEYLGDNVKVRVVQNLECFHEFLHGYKDIFTTNIYAAGLVQKKDIAADKGDKVCSIVIIKNWIHDGVIRVHIQKLMTTR